jgi:hypothetical protein
MSLGTGSKFGPTILLRQSVGGMAEIESIPIDLFCEDAYVEEFSR